MDQGSNSPEQAQGIKTEAQVANPAPAETSQAPAGNPSLEPQQAPQPQDSVVGKSETTTYAVGSQGSEAGPKVPVDHESVADKLFAPFKKLMNTGKAPQNVAPENPDSLTGDQPHVANPNPDPQPQG